MGGCSSKPQIIEPEVRSPPNQELNLLLSGLKAIDPSSPSSYKGSQNTLQSLFIKHHRDGEDVLKDAQTLKELLQDPKPPPSLDGNTEVGSKGLQQQQQQQQQEQENQASSPISVLPDLVHQDAEKFGKTEQLLLPLEVRKPNIAAKLDDGASAVAQTATHEDPLAPSISAEQHADHHGSSESADCRILGVSDARESNVQALDAQAAECGIDRHDHEVKGGQNPGKAASESKIDGTTEEHAMEGAVKSKMQADFRESLEAHKSEARHEEATTETRELLVAHQAEYFPKSCLESESTALEETEEKAMEGEKAGVQAVEAEEMGIQDREMGIQNVDVEHPGFLDKSHEDETACVEAVVAMRESSENHEAMEKERAIAIVLPSHVDSKEVAVGESANLLSIEEALSCEVNEELEAGQAMLTQQQPDLGSTEKDSFGEKLASSGSAVEMEKLEAEKKPSYSAKSTEIELPEAASKEEVFLEVLPAARDEAFEHEQQTHDSPVEVEVDKKVEDPALELSSRGGKEADSAVSKHKLLDSKSTDKLESIKTDPTVEFEHEKNSADDVQGKQEESFQLANNEQSDGEQSSVKEESIHSGQIEQSSSMLDSNTHTDVEAEGSLHPRQGEQKESLPN